MTKILRLDSLFPGESETRDLPVGGVVFDPLSRDGRWKRKVLRPDDNSRSYLNVLTKVTLGGLVVSVLATGPRFAGSNPAEDDGF
jgi:hypothetical protein